MKLLHWFAAGALVLPLSGLISEQSAIASDLTRQLQQSSFGISSPLQRQESDRLLEAGITQSSQGNVSHAVKLWKSAAENYRLLNDMEGQQRAYEYLSQAYQTQNRPRELEDALRQQLRFARARRDFPSLVGHYNQVGELLLAQSSTLQSEKTFSEALRIAQELKDLPGQGRSLTNLGLAALQGGRYAQAATYLTQSIALHQQTPNEKSVKSEAIAQNALGTAYRNLGEAQKSAGAHLNALILARAGSDVVAQDQAMAGLSIAYRNLGANQEAKNWLEARLSASSGTTTIARITALRAMAEFYQRNGDLAQTDRYYRDAIATATQGGYPQEAQDLSQKLENLRRIHHLGPRRNG
jgi:tetratricopeptide (TPR) repeat protein